MLAKSTSTGVSRPRRLIVIFATHLVLLTSVIFPSLHSNGPLLIMANSQTSRSVPISSLFSVRTPLSCSSSSALTGTGTVPAPKKPVTFGVFRTMYQDSLVTIILTRIYHGKIFFLRCIFLPPDRMDRLS